MAQAASLIRSSYLQNVQADRATVLWTTAQPGTGSVTFEKVAERGRKTRNDHATALSAAASLTAPATVQVFEPSQTKLASAYYQYRADLAGLTPATEYSYRVSMNGLDVSNGQDQFQTAPEGAFSFLAFGDSGSCSEEQKKLIQLMVDETDISMVLHLGDLAYTDGTFEQFESNYYGLNAQLMRRLPFFPTPGNHDYYTDFAAPYLSGIVVPESGVQKPDQGRYYSFDWGYAHFASVDSNLLGTASEARMLAWLDADLVEARRHWKIVFLHHTPYPTAFHLGDSLCVAVQQRITPILDRHGVHLLLAGHEHAYERTHPLAAGKVAAPGGTSTMYVVSGGGGGALEAVGSLSECALSVQAFHYLRVNVGREAISFSAVGLDGEVIDRVRLGPGTEITVDSVLSRGDYTALAAPGSLVSISGRNLSGRIETSPNYPVRRELGGVSVQANGRGLPLQFVSPTQIQAQIPYEASGALRLEILTPDQRVSTSLTLSPAAPSLLAIAVGGATFSATNPARPGGQLTLYLTGLGLTEPADSTGIVTARVAPFEVWLGECRLEPLSIGPAHRLAGVYRVDVKIPGDLDDGIYALCVVSDGVSSRPANLDVVHHATAYRRGRACAVVHARPL